MTKDKLLAIGDRFEAQIAADRAGRRGVSLVVNPAWQD